VKIRGPCHLCGVTVIALPAGRCNWPPGNLSKNREKEFLYPEDPDKNDLRQLLPPWRWRVPCPARAPSPAIHNIELHFGHALRYSDCVLGRGETRPRPAPSMLCRRLPGEIEFARRLDIVEAFDRQGVRSALHHVRRAARLVRDRFHRLY